MGLTDEQRRRMEESRRKAMEKRNQQKSGPSSMSGAVGNAGNNNSFKPNVNSNSSFNNNSSKNFNTGSSNQMNKPNFNSGFNKNSSANLNTGSANQMNKPNTVASSFQSKPNANFNSSNNNNQNNKTLGGGTLSSNTSSAQPKTSSNFYSGNSASNDVMKPGNSGTSSGFNSGNKSGNFNSTANNKSSGYKPDLKWNPGHWNPGNKSNSAHSEDFSHNMNLKPDGKTNLFDKNEAPKKAAIFVKTITGHIRLISKERFVVEMGFHQGAIDVFKTMESRMYDPTTRKWSFALTEHDTLVKALMPMKPEVTCAPLPQSIRRVLLESSQYPPLGSIDLSGLDPKLLDTLMPFQYDGVCFGVSRRGRCLIADDMGLGKTIQALGIASYYKQHWPLLIVSPSSVRFNWKNSVVRWLSSVSEYDVTVVTKGKDEFKSAQVVVISYDLLSKKKKEIDEMGFNIAIFDESHYLKNYKSARYKVAQPIMQKVKCLVLLSGTPALSRPIELFTQISAVDRKIFPNFNDYGIRYCAGQQNNWGWDFNGFSNLEELQIVLESKILIRRLKKDVLKQLPAKQRMTIILDPTSVESSTKAMKEAAKMMGVKTLGGSEKHSAMLQYFSETAYAKIKAVGEYMKELLENGKKFLIFAHHQVMMNKLERVCREEKVQYMRIDGSTSSEDRQMHVDRFQSREDVRVAVLSITAANAGITLTAAHLVVFAELFWNPGILIQAEDRVHRIGQEDSVLVQYLVAQKTADDHIWNMIQEKLEILSKAGLNKDNFKESDTLRQKDRNQTEITEYYGENGDKGDKAEGTEADAATADTAAATAAAAAATAADGSLDDGFEEDFPLDGLMTQPPSKKIADDFDDDFPIEDLEAHPPSKKRKTDSLFESF